VNTVSDRFHAAAAAAAAAVTELDGRGNLPKMKMLQKMRLLEEQGSSFASTAIKDLKVFGELRLLWHASLLLLFPLWLAAGCWRSRASASHPLTSRTSRFSVSGLWHA
jgi:hypothetical protein